MNNDLAPNWRCLPERPPPRFQPLQAAALATDLGEVQSDG